MNNRENTYLTCWAKKGCTSQVLEPCDVAHDGSTAHKRTRAFAAQKSFARLVNSNGGG